MSDNLKGCLIKLKQMKDPQAIESGTYGIVDYIDDAGTLHMLWENGRSLGVIPSEDEFTIESSIGENGEIIFSDKGALDKYLKITNLEKGIEYQMLIVKAIDYMVNDLEISFLEVCEALEIETTEQLVNYIDERNIKFWNNFSFRKK